MTFARSLVVVFGVLLCVLLTAHSKTIHPPNCGIVPGAYIAEFLDGFDSVSTFFLDCDPIYWNVSARNAQAKKLDVLQMLQLDYEKSRSRKPSSLQKISFEHLGRSQSLVVSE